MNPMTILLFILFLVVGILIAAGIVITEWLGDNMDFLP